jgi:glycosyltransferase involved in cell wall biosynthesis
MPPRKLLLVTCHFPPSAAVASHRFLGFARHLPKFGWRVTVVAPPTLPGEPTDEELRELVPPQTKVHAVPYPRGWLSRQVDRFLYRGAWLPRAFLACSRVIRRERPDVLMTSSPPQAVHLLGLMLKACFGLPWLVCFRDPWVTNNGRTCEQLLGLTWNSFAERRVMAGADRVIANTPLAHEGYAAAYPEHRHKLAWVPNGFDPDRFGPPQAQAPQGERLVLLHAGELYNGRDPRPLLDALGELERARRPGARPWRLRLLGHSTDRRFDLQAMIRQRGLHETVELGGQVPYRQALAAMQRADILLLLDTPARRVSIPAKLYEYLGAGRPILALTAEDGDVAWALRTAGAPCRIAPPQDVASIVQALTGLRDDLEAGRLTPPAAERLNVFTREQMARGLADNLNLCLQPAPAPSPQPLSPSQGEGGDLVPLAPASGERGWGEGARLRHDEPIDYAAAAPHSPSHVGA